ncbi:hypothetical protein ATKI12_2466 [Kitasatospora sp. Ki12]
MSRGAASPCGAAVATGVGCLDTDSTGLSGFTRLPVQRTVTARARGSLLHTTARPRRVRQTRRPTPAGAPPYGCRTTRGASPQSTGACGAARPEHRERGSVGPCAGAEAGQQGTANPAATGPRGGTAGVRGRPGPAVAPPARSGSHPAYAPVRLAPLRASPCAETPQTTTHRDHRHPCRRQMDRVELRRIGCRASPPSRTMLGVGGSPGDLTAHRGVRRRWLRGRRPGRWQRFSLHAP